MSSGQLITPCLWFEKDAEQAAEFYVSLFPASRIDRIMRSPAENPSCNAGDVLVIDFTLAGQSYQALNGGPHDVFNDAISLSVSCKDQAEVDRLWEGLTSNGGRAVRCGWLKDRFGVSWQIIPEALGILMTSGNAEQSKRVMEAMLQMIKIDIGVLQKTFDEAR